MVPLIFTENLSKTYKLEGLEVPALKGVNLQIREGEMVAVMGPSGCGKSTLLHLLGLLDTPSLGQVIFKGRNVGRLNEDERADFRSREVGFVFQSFNLLPRISALENVLLPTIYRSLQGVPLRGRLAEGEARKLLSDLDLFHRLEHKPNQLSGGEQQRVAIARALINNPSLILADEPTGNLDSQSGEEILNILKSLNRQGRTIIVVTHEQNVSSACPRVVKMKDGQVVDQFKM